MATQENQLESTTPEGVETEEWNNAIDEYCKRVESDKIQQRLPVLDSNKCGFALTKKPVTGQRSNRLACWRGHSQGQRGKNRLPPLE
jgi:hypothetical protein